MLKADANLKLFDTKTESSGENFSVFATETVQLEGTRNAQLTGGEVIVTGDATTSIKAPIVNIN